MELYPLFGRTLPIRLAEADREHETIELFERAGRLSPNQPWRFEFGYGFALHLAGREEEAIAAYGKAINAGAVSAPLRARLAAVYADLGQMDKAKAAIENALRQNPSFTVAKYLKSNPYPGDERQGWYRDLLIRAGLPE
jgi:tetratricopeptide (TPR) repeat protein